MARLLLLACLLASLGLSAAQAAPPTLEDWWAGRAVWRLDRRNVGLPMGESDTLAMPYGQLWSYAHASSRSHGLVDSCGQPVPFPGCLALWQSRDAGRSFYLDWPACLIPCGACPCQDARDHIEAQQYPRLAQAADGTLYMAYEWHAQTILRRSADGLIWSDWAFLTTPGGTWPVDFAACSSTERIGAHPFIRGQADGCLVGGPPGLYVEGDTLYVFVTAGSAPSHIRCYRGDRHGPLDALRPCDHDPLFGGAREYGPLDAYGAAANPYFDFRYVSSAEVLKAGQHYYMAYEGIRGPDALERGLDTQFALGFARSLGDEIDGSWEVYPHNPVLLDSGFNWGVGHADLIVLDGVTYLYTATSQETRGRYVLAWAED